MIYASAIQNLVNATKKDNGAVSSNWNVCSEIISKFCNFFILIRTSPVFGQSSKTNLFGSMGAAGPSFGAPTATDKAQTFGSKEPIFGSKPTVFVSKDQSTFGPVFGSKEEQTFGSKDSGRTLFGTTATAAAGSTFGSVDAVPTFGSVSSTGGGGAPSFSTFSSTASGNIIISLGNIRLKHFISAFVFDAEQNLLYSAPR